MAESGRDEWGGCGRLKRGIFEVFPEVEKRFVTRGNVLDPFSIPFTPDTPGAWDGDAASSTSHVDVCGII